MRRLMAILQALLAGSGLSLALVYFVGRIATDRFRWSQYLSWVPTVVYLAALLVPIVFALTAGWVGRKWEADHAWYTPESRARSRWPVWLTRACLICLLLGVLHLGWSECRLYRYIVRPAAPASASLVVVHWNVTYVEPPRWEEYVSALRATLSRAEPPDVVVITNPTWGPDLDRLSAALGPEYRTVRAGVFALSTRLPIVRKGSASLGIPSFDQPGALLDSDNQHDQTMGELLPSWSPIPRVGGSTHDPGNVMFAELDATASLGRHVVIYAMDLPSDVRLSRYANALKAAARLADLRAAGPAPFPGPDVIVGDFNTPRGSASLAVLTPGMTHAYEQAGRGYAATWPREHRGSEGQRLPNRFPIFHLDHVFVSSAFRAIRYELLDPKIGEHLVQRAVILKK